MAGTISEFFGYRAEDKSKISLKAATDRKCPFLGTACTKLLGRTREISGVCAIRQKKAGSPSVICCPNRIYAEDYKMLHTVSRMAFATELPLYAGRTAVAKAKSKGGAVAVFGHGWGGELRLPKRNGVGSYFVDWVLARLDGMGQLVDFTAVEVQTIDTTGKYSDARKALKKDWLWVVLLSRCGQNHGMMKAATKYRKPESLLLVTAWQTNSSRLRGTMPV
jgi:hypothetical protein